MKKNRLLGESKERVRTDVRLPENLWRQVKDMCDEIGVPQNVFYAIAACKLLVSFSGLKKGQKKRFLLKEIQSVLQKIKSKLS